MTNYLRTAPSAARLVDDFYGVTYEAGTESGIAQLKLWRSADGKLVWEIVEQSNIVRFTTQQIDEFVILATKNPNTNKVMLGMYIENNPLSYHIRASSEGYTFFQLEEWGVIYKQVANNYDEMWRINKKFLDDQIAAGKKIYFSHDPNTASTQGLIREINYLKEKGYSNIIELETGKLWEITK